MTIKEAWAQANKQDFILGVTLGLAAIGTGVGWSVVLGA